MSTADGYNHHTLTTASSTRKHYPRIPWLDEAWRFTSNRYERIATATPRLDVHVLGFELVAKQINMTPNLDSLADFVPVLSRSNSRIIGFRPKIATWPLTQKEAMRVKVW